MNKNKYVLGLNAAYHESSACLFKDGEMIAFIEEERLNRVKHAKESMVDNSDQLPQQAIAYCLQKAGISLNKVDHIAYSLNPEKRLRENMVHHHPYEVSADDFGSAEGERLFYEHNLLVEEKLRSDGFKGDFHYLNHHDCHAAGAFFLSGFDTAAILVIDGIAEFESTTIYTADKGHLKALKSISYPNSLGFLWEKISKYLGFSEYDVAKVMGLSAYGQAAVYKKRFRKLVNVKEDGSFGIDDSIIQFRSENYTGLEQLFEAPKRMQGISAVGPKHQDYADIAASLQEVTEEILLKLCKNIREVTRQKNLCLSGGVALNCVANSKLIYENIFKNIFVQPQAHDAGTAIGAACYLLNYTLLERKIVFPSRVFFGPVYTDELIYQELGRSNLKFKRVKDIERMVAELIADGNLVALFQGDMESGPRALGRRSILGDPRNSELHDVINRQVKYREQFRPLCPSILAEYAHEWFDMNDEIPDATRYMLAAMTILPGKRGSIPAVVHVNNTARIQVVEKESSPEFWKVLQEFRKLTNVPVLINTSFNIQEPIVCSPADAIATFSRSKLNFLAIGNFICERR
ncbi:carbamoyltransferase family protein [Mucilaginibacter sp. HD30]